MSHSAREMEMMKRTCASSNSLLTLAFGQLGVEGALGH